MKIMKIMEIAISKTYALRNGFLFFLLLHGLVDRRTRKMQS